MSLSRSTDERNRIDAGLADAKTILTLLEGLTEGVIHCEPLRGAVKVAKEIVDMIQVSYYVKSLLLLG
jgi:hypothetical protein